MNQYTLEHVLLMRIVFYCFLYFIATVKLEISLNVPVFFQKFKCVICEMRPTRFTCFPKPCLSWEDFATELHAHPLQITLFQI